jgi:hypothetical protein
VKCTFLPGSREKRFVKAMAFRAENDPELELTENQAKYLTDLVHKYRKQLAAKGFQFPEMTCLPTTTNSTPKPPNGCGTSSKPA